MSEANTQTFETFMIIDTGQALIKHEAEQMLGSEEPLKDFAAQIDWEGEIEPGKVLCAGVIINGEWVAVTCDKVNELLSSH